MGPTRLLLGLLVVASSLVTPASTTASHLGVYFDLAGTENALSVDPLQSFTWYVIASDVSAGIYGFEFTVSIDPQITVTGRAAVPSTAINIGVGSDNWIVGAGACLPTFGGARLVAYTGMLLADEDYLRIELDSAEPSSTGRSGPGYLECDSPEVLVFDTLSGALLNPEQNSWGAVKDLYRD